MPVTITLATLGISLSALPPVGLAAPATPGQPGLRLITGGGGVLTSVVFQSGQHLQVANLGRAAQICASTPWALLQSAGATSIAGQSPGWFGFALTLPDPTTVTLPPLSLLASLTIASAGISGVTVTGNADVPPGKTIPFATVGDAAGMARIDPLTVLAMIGAAPGVTWTAQ